MTTLYYEASDELCHYGVKGMKWGRRRYQNSDGSLTPAGKKRYITVRDGYNNARKAYKNAYNSSTEQSGGKKKGLVTIHESGKAKREARNSGRKAAIESVRNDKAANKEARNTPEAKAARRKKALKVGAAVAGTALAAYGGYKVAQYAQNRRSQVAAQKAKSYIDKNALRNVRVSTFADGRTEMEFVSGSGKHMITEGTRKTAGKGIGRYNAEVVAEARKMYQDSTNTRIDRGLGKIVDAGDAVGKATQSARTNAAKTANTAKNRVLDVVKPVYEYTPSGTRTSVRDFGDGIVLTEKTTDYVKRKVKRQ